MFYELIVECSYDETSPILALRSTGNLYIPNVFHKNSWYGKNPDTQIFIKTSNITLQTKSHIMNQFYD